VRAAPEPAPVIALPVPVPVRAAAEPAPVIALPVPVRAAPEPAPAVTTSAIAVPEGEPVLVTRARAHPAPVAAQPAAPATALPAPEPEPVLATRATTLPAPVSTELAAPAGPSLDFDLLGSSSEIAAAAAPSPELEQSVGMRRTMLTVHQTLGIGLTGLMGATMVTGQLNYLDRFGGPSTARYQSSHAFLATATLATFAGAGLLAFFAPVPLEKKSDGIDRVAVHKWSMIGATVGMVAEGTLGILTANREGYADQATLARARLGIGYFTLLCMTVGVSALVF
jgi:hypothetical protein